MARKQCQVCGQPATVRVEANLNGRHSTMLLCDDHYRQLVRQQKRTVSPLEALFGSRSGLFEDFLGSDFFRIGDDATPVAADTDDVVDASFGEPAAAGSGAPRRRGSGLASRISEQSEALLQEAAKHAAEFGRSEVDTEHLLLALAAAGDILLAVVLAKVMRKNAGPEQKIDTADDFVRAVTPVLQSETDLLAEQLRAMQGESARTTSATLRDFSAVLAENQRQSAANSTARLEAIDRAGAARQRAANDALLAQLTMMENRLKNLEDSNATRMDSVRGALVQGLNTIRADNNKKLDEIRGTVEEKLQDTLQQRINDSFKTVSAQLEQVYKGLGEMQNLAADVGSLKQVLSGVKTRGILGEVQLGAILEQILAPGQYEENVATVPGSTNRVEFAVKLPGQGGPVWLPIDAKFPGDTYAHLQAAQQRGDAAAVNAMRKALNNVLRAEAKDIHDKYIEVPYTTSFGILFLPFEGLYAEVVSSGVTELLQREYQITVAGPSTMAALLNALQMGFRTLAIQKRSGEVWTILGAVKTEFEKFGTGLQQMQRHLNQTGSDLEELIGPRSRAITRKLESVQQLDPDAAAELLGLEK